MKYAAKGTPTNSTQPPAQTKNAGVDAVIACNRMTPV